jgi:hypothetical protein
MRSRHTESVVRLERVKGRWMEGLGHLTDFLILGNPGVYKKDIGSV